MKRKIGVVTGSRAEFGLLQWVIKGIANDADMELVLLVTGMHLSPEFGLTYREIEANGYRIDHKVEILLSSDSPVGVSKSMGLGMISFAEIFDREDLDILVLMGDRFEILAAASSALVANIPIAHIHGGETTEGAFDEAIRHSITKMAHLHFTTTAVYRDRVIQLGEHPKRVFHVGAPGLDSIAHLDLMDRAAFEASIDFNLKARNIMVTFHPVTLEGASGKEQFQSLLDAIDELDETTVIFTKPNADTGGRILIKMIDDYVASHADTAIAFQSLGQLRYLSALKHVDAVVGNSSSGIIEAPSFKVATVNIGDRQKGRVRSESVIDCKPDKASILGALDQALHPDFKESLATVQNKYGPVGASERIVQTLKAYDLKDILKKSFYDIPINKSE